MSCTRPSWRRPSWPREAQGRWGHHQLSGTLPMHLKAFARAMQGYEGYSQLESKPALYSVIKPSRQGRARTQFPTTRNCAVEIPTFEEFAGVRTTGVQWPSLALGKQPS